MKFITKAFAVVGAILTITGFYELIFKERYVPHISSYFNVCGDEDQMVKEITDFGNLIFNNVGNTVYIDYDFVFTCEEEIEGELLFESEGEYSYSSISDDDKIITINSTPTIEYAPSILTKVDRANFKGKGLSIIQPGLSEFSGDRIVGLFFVRGNLAAGVYEVDLFPVPYSDALQEKLSCSKALAENKNESNNLRVYVESCLLKQRKPELQPPNSEDE